MPNKNILDVLYKQLPGFHKGVVKNFGNEHYLVKNSIAVFIIDGYNTYEDFLSAHGAPDEGFDKPPTHNIGTPSKFTILTKYLESILQSITAEDVAGIEILHIAKNKNTYEQYYNLYDDYNRVYTFIEITTHSGNGPFNNRSSGMWLYKPIVPVVARKFYSPLYTNASSNNSLPDFRSTIFWKPDLVTNDKGEASFSFYTSDNSGGYLVIVQGTDLSGGLGAVYLPLTIKAQEKKPGN